MNRTYLIAIAAALLAAPLAWAHEPKGTYKTYCEPAHDWFVHEYGPPASGNRVQGPEDGNIGGDCDPGFSFDPGYVCAGFDPNDPLNTFLVGLCDASLNPPLADHDGHAEYSRGGAWLLSESGDGQPNANPHEGAGAFYCYGDAAHHANFVTVTVDDLTLGRGTSALIAADTIDITGRGQGCGDGEDDVFVRCPPTCTAPFPAGLDGSYRVYVELGTQGHITTN